MFTGAFVQFEMDKNTKTNKIKINAKLPLTDFSFDFQDLNFSRVQLSIASIACRYNSCILIRLHLSHSSGITYRWIRWKQWTWIVSAQKPFNTTIACTAIGVGKDYNYCLVK